MIKFFEKLLSIVVFICLLYSALFALSFMFTNERYINNENVSSQFPIAVFEKGKPKIILWYLYNKSPEQYNLLMLKKMTTETYVLNEFEKFTIKKNNANIFTIKYKIDDYIFYSRYQISKNRVLAKSFRLAAAIMVIPALGVAFLLTNLMTNLLLMFFSLIFSKNKGKKHTGSIK